MKCLQIRCFWLADCYQYTLSGRISKVCIVQVAYGRY